MPVSYHDSIVARLHDDICALIDGDDSLGPTVSHRLCEIARANNPGLRRYWPADGDPGGVPDGAFREGALFHFRDAEPVRTFMTSGTSGRRRGVAQYSARGLDLMHRSIVANAGRHVFDGLDRPAVIRLVPEPEAAPDNIMAHGMALLGRHFGDPATSRSVVGAKGLDVAALRAALDRVVAEARPAVLIGGSFAFVHAHDALADARWHLPPGSRVVDAGGFKGRSREIDVTALRMLLADRLEVPARAFVNLFGMTELASQLYDSADRPVGPNGERPKGPCAFVRPRVRDPLTWEVVAGGPGLLEVEDLCVIDRPHLVLTGDWAIAAADGAAITGRAVAGETRGCALCFEAPHGA